MKQLKVKSIKQHVEELPPKNGWKCYRATGLFDIEIEMGAELMRFKSAKI